MLYELLSGQLPWQGAETASELLSQRLREDPIPLRDVATHIPQPLADVVMTALSRDVETRYQRAEDLGVAIGEACADSWGPGWLDHSGVAIVGSERLSRAARTTGHREAVSAPPTGAAPAAVVTGTGTAGETIARGGTDVPGASETTVTGRAGTQVPGASETGVAGAPAAAPDGAHETIARPAAPADAPRVAAATGAVAPVDEPATVPAPVTHAPGAAPEFQVVKAAAAEPRIYGADLYQLELADLIGVEDVLDPPKPPWPAIALMATAFAAAVLVAVFGLGDPDRSGTLEAGQVEVAGVDVVSGGRIEADLSEDLIVTITDADLAERVDGVEIAMGPVGVPMSTISGSVQSGQAVVDTGITQRTIGGQATATVTISDGDDVLGEQEVGVDATQTWYLTVPFVAGVLLVLLALANLESSLKPLRSGHPRLLSTVGAAISGAMLGGSAVVFAGALGLAEPTVAAGSAAAALGVIGGIAAARARVGVAKRRRVRRAVKRAERSLGVQAKAA
jgi:hypothetical protein